MGSGLVEESESISEAGRDGVITGPLAERAA